MRRRLAYLIALLLLAGSDAAWARPYRCYGMPEIADLPITLGIETHGQKIGGMGIVTMATASLPHLNGHYAAGTNWSLTLLSPGGLALFTARGTFNDSYPEDPAAIETGLDAWKPWLEKLPLGRDLRTAFSTIDDRSRSLPGAPGKRRWDCAGGTTRTRPHTFSDGVSGWIRRWRGPGGPVRAEITADRVILHDKLRGYTLTIVAPNRSLPDGPEGMYP